MQEEMQEAFAAIGEQSETTEVAKEVTEVAELNGKEIVVAEAKVPDGKTIVGICLSRDEKTSGRWMSAVGHSWAADGMAIAIRSGHVLAANYVFGRWSNGIPKITAAHYVKCRKCGKRILMPHAVWEAKDAGRKAGVLGTELDKLGGFELLNRYGHCSCGGKWSSDRDEETRELKEFSGRVLKSVSEGGKIPHLLLPRFFSVVNDPGKGVDLGEEWMWLKDAMFKNGKAAIPFAKGVSPDTVVFNPGYWLGWVDDYDDTELFFLERGKDRFGRGRDRDGFNPAGCDGL